MEDGSLHPTAESIVNSSLMARGAILMVLNVDGSYEVSWHNLTYVEVLGLLEAAKMDILAAMMSEEESGGEDSSSDVMTP